VKIRDPFPVVYGKEEYEDVEKILFQYAPQNYYLQSRIGIFYYTGHNILESNPVNFAFPSTIASETIDSHHGDFHHIVRA
jgi:hypothetical protein